MFWILYLCFIASTIKYMFLTLGIIGFIIGLGFFIGYVYFSLAYKIGYGEEDKDYKACKVGAIIFKKVTIIFFIIMLLGCLVPTTEQLLISISIDKFSKSDYFNDTNRITKKALNLLENKLDKYLEDKKE